MLLQLVYEEKSGFERGQDYSCNSPVYATPPETAKPKPPRKNIFRKRLHESDEVKPREGLPIDETEYSLCVAIWRSVVVQAMYDLGGRGGNIERKIIRAESQAWFSESVDGESDFEMVCGMANLEPTQVRKIAKQIRENGEELTGWFNFRSVRKEYSSRVGTRRTKTLKI